MTFIDWSDPEDLLGLLVEFVRDEKTASHGDEARYAFLSGLETRLIDELDPASVDSIQRTIERLRVICGSTDPAFADDAVMTHLRACIEELERIRDTKAV